MPDIMTMAIIWLIALIVLVIIEIISQGLTTIWFAGGSLVALISTFCGANLFVQIAIFLVVSIILLIFTRPIAMLHFNKKVVPTNVETLPGEVCVITEAVDNIGAKGKAELNGMEWTVRSASEGILIPEGARAKVLRVEGVKLIVEQVN
ncbi:Membrane protein implicated in regulation of membrane protease activity [Lachnospiraceae bacterium XPB1003]|nr:Membrane protein implicated in regulation of membrane protease activity [Lachnospiraceae bacterium XPB1003]